MTKSRFIAATLRLLLGAAAGLAAGGGCMVGPHYRPPDDKLPDAFDAVPLSQPATGRIVARSESLEQWWTVFQDPELNSLVERALRNNRDLKEAVSRVRQARAERAIVAGGLTPDVAVTAGYDRALGSNNVQIPLSQLAGSSTGASAAGGGSSSGSSSAARADQVTEPGASGGSASSSAGTGIPPGGPNSPFGEGGLPGVTTNLYQVGFDASWELDFFGGARRAVQAADAELAAAREGERAVRISLLAEVASYYIQLRLTQQRTAIARRNLEAQRQTYAIAQDRFHAGLGTELPAEQQRTQWRSTAATLPALEGAARSTEHELAFILGEDPDALAGELDPPRNLPPIPPEIPVGVPSELLRRRPDVRRAERQLAAATADVGVATAALFPQFSLTGLAGLDSSDLKHLPEWSSHYYSISPGIQWPILEWRSVHAAIRVQNELQAQALLGYQTAVAQALKEVEDALVSYQTERTRRLALAEAEGAAQRSLTVARQTYSSGLVDQLAALVAEGQLLQAEDAVAQSDASLRTDLVALYKALGGGWRVDAPTQGSG
jgi:NodT family efflux transporter outer membrane factor (OMF) lipoprotein